LTIHIVVNKCIACSLASARPDQRSCPTSDKYVNWRSRHPAKGQLTAGMAILSSILNRSRVFCHIWHWSVGWL